MKKRSPYKNGHPMIPPAHSMQAEVAAANLAALGIILTEQPPPPGVPATLANRGAPPLKPAAKPAAQPAKRKPAAPKVTIPHALAESAARVERDLLACGVDRARAQTAKARVLALGMMAAQPVKVPPLDEKDPRVASLRRMLSQARLSEKAIAGAVRRHWQRLHGAL